MFKLYSFLQGVILYIYRGLLWIVFNTNVFSVVKIRFMFKYVNNIRRVFIGPKDCVKKENTVFNIIVIIFILSNLLIMYFSFINNFKNKVKSFISTKFLYKKTYMTKQIVYSKNFFLLYKSFQGNISKLFNLVFINLVNFKFFFLRKNTIYIKSKFSKSRLFTKSIVYFSLILNFIVINELHLIYYNISINYSYLYIYVFFLFVDVLFSVFKRNKSGSLIEEQRSSKPLILVQVQSTLACLATSYYALIL